jgi:hypothetical protein
LAKPNRQHGSRNPKHGNPPLSRHPLFPAIVALWFAALVGLGSFALSTSLIERIVLAAGIDAAIPAAAPPLGITARLLRAAVVGAVGGLIGWAVAWRLAHAQARPAPKVFSVREAELNDERLPWPSMEAPHDRADPAGPTLDPASLETETADHAPAGNPEPAAAPEPTPEPTAAERIASANLRELSPVELVERLAIALQRRQERLGTMPDRARAASRSRDQETVPQEWSADATEPVDPVVHFPGLGDRQQARLVPASSPSRPQETEKALRDALAQLQRMSSRG